MSPSRKIRRFARLLAALATIAFAAWCFLPKPPLLDGIEFSRRVFDRNGRLLFVSLTADEKYRVFTPLAEISPELIRATLLHEDQHFWSHPGINPVPILRSAWNLLVHGHARAGASTVTMQLARMRCDIYSRTLTGKLSQMATALGYERHYSKAQILEAYLNLAPYGGNIEGIGAASDFYFHKPAAHLTLHESIALSVIPQSPARRAPRPGEANPELVAAHHRLFEKMAATDDLHPLGEGYTAAARVSRGMLAPHFTTEILAENPRAAEIHTTLDLPLQQIVERSIQNYVARQERVGVHNAAAMLLDFRTMEVLAQAGSADFRNVKIRGQVDGTRSPRSPGSALKPFVYALAMEQGLIHPLTMVADAPRSFGSYNPENFDREFCGPLTATEALARSRNLPAVALAAQLHRPTLYQFLRAAGVRLPHGESFYGLALPLGGAEVTMEDLVRLYSILANDGMLRALHRTALHDTSTERGVRLLSPEAAFLTREMLGHITRPDLAEGAPVYWKTGTSHGFCDAWSVAIFDDYVLAVWIGNFDGRGNPAFIGRTCAGPLLFGIIDALRASGRIPRATFPNPPPGLNLRRVELCAVSGQLPSAACPRRIEGWFIPGVSPIRECEIHREILVDAETGLRVPADDGKRPVRREVFEFWPANLRALFAQAGLPRRDPPPFAPDSGVEALARRGRAPHIISPRPGMIYTLRAGDVSHRELPLLAEAGADATCLYWFAGKTFLGRSSPRQPLNYAAQPGAVTIVALDDHGRSASCALEVKMAE